MLLEDKNVLLCAGCRQPTHIHKLDARMDKDGNPLDADDVLYCQRCYGPGWLPTDHMTFREYLNAMSTPRHLALVGGIALLSAGIAMWPVP